MHKTDYLQKFHFNNIAVRGAIVKLSNTYIEALNGRPYPPPVNQILGNCLCATSLMASHLKHSNTLILQARGSGSVSLLMAESNTQVTREVANLPDINQTLRCVARINDQADQLPTDHSMTLREILDDAQLVVTIEPERGERYQGIIPCDQATLAESVEDYFRHSEQLPTVMVFATSETQAVGLMLQQIPVTAHRDIDNVDSLVSEQDWEEVQVLTRSITEEELLSLDSETILHRLFHQHSVNTTLPSQAKFACSCSAERTQNALKQVPIEDLEAILAEDGEIVMDCEFCSARYHFDRSVLKLLNGSSGISTH